MDAAELYISTLDQCRICGEVVNKGALGPCMDCGLLYCENCYCKCPITVPNEEWAAFLREENPDGVYIIGGDEEAA